MIQKRINIALLTSLWAFSCSTSPSKPSPSAEPEALTQAEVPVEQHSVEAPVEKTVKPPEVDKDSVTPGSAITKKGATLELYGTPISVDKPFPSIALKDAFNNNVVDISKLPKQVTVVSVVPSVNTPVCEAQTHILGEEEGIGQTIRLITVSRDSEADLKRFAEGAKLTNITYLSDKTENSFGAATGLGVKDADILARAVLVLDEEGVVKHLQVVPEVTHLPDMKSAFDIARKLDADSK